MMLYVTADHQVIAKSADQAADLLPLPLAQAKTAYEIETLRGQIDDCVSSIAEYRREMQDLRMRLTAAEADQRNFDAAERSQ